MTTGRTRERYGNEMVNVGYFNFDMKMILKNDWNKYHLAADFSPNSLRHTVKLTVNGDPAVGGRRLKGNRMTIGQSNGEWWLV